MGRCWTWWALWESRVVLLVRVGAKKIELHDLQETKMRCGGLAWWMFDTRIGDESWRWMEMGRRKVWRRGVLVAILLGVRS